jgi:hypothetical protein
MALKIGAMLIAAAALLSACGEEACTTEVAQKKMADVTAKATAVMTASPDKAAALTAKMTELGTKMSAGGDMAAVCKGLDEMMVELSK